jgi:hypothetical protein
MTDLERQLSRLHRPGLLVQAARVAANAPCAARRAGRRPFAKLLAEEEMLNDARLGDGLSYSPRRHVQVMSALMCAARSSGA